MSVPVEKTRMNFHADTAWVRIVRAGNQANSASYEACWAQPHPKHNISQVMLLFLIQ